MTRYPHHLIASARLLAAALLMWLSHSTPMRADPLPTPSLLQTQINTVPWSNGQRLVTGSTFRSLFQNNQSIFAGMGTWDPVTGQYTLPSGKVTGLSPVAQSGGETALNLKYTAPYGGSVLITQSAKNAQTVNVDEFGAVGDGVTDDSEAIRKAYYSRADKGGIVQLSCAKNYFVGTSITLGAPGVTLRHCWNRPTLFRNNIGVPDPRFIGSVNTVGKIIRAPTATISIGNSGGLADLAIIQQGLTLPMPDTSTYSGTAVALSPGGNGTASHLDNVLIIGGTYCVDGSHGGAAVEFHHVNEDCINGNYNMGQSPGGSVYEDIDVGVFGTQDFAGFPITGVVGDGTTTTVSFTYPAGTTQAAFPVNDLVTLRGVTASSGLLYPSVYGYKITASTQSGSSGTVSFASTVNTTTTPVTATGNLTEHTKQFLRSGTANSWINGCDDMHVGRMSEFGYNIAYDIQCRGITNFGHLWADNSNIGLRVGRGSNPPDPGQAVVATTINSFHFAGTGGIGIQLNSVTNPAQSNLLIDDFIATGISSNCAQVTGTLQIGNAHIEGCQSFGFNVTAGAKLYIGNLDAKVSTLGTSAFVPGQPAENVQIGHASTDGPAGGSLYGGVLRSPSVLASAGTLNLPMTSVTNGVETYAVSGSATITNIGACWGNRAIRLIFTGTATLATGGNIAASAGGTAGSIYNLVCDVSTNPSSPVWRRPS